VLGAGGKPKMFYARPHIRDFGGGFLSTETNAVGESGGMYIGGRRLVFGQLWYISAIWRQWVIGFGGRSSQIGFLGWMITTNSLKADRQWEDQQRLKGGTCVP